MSDTDFWQFVVVAMNTWGEDVFAELARGFVFNRYSAFYSPALVKVSPTAESTMRENPASH